MKKVAIIYRTLFQYRKDFYNQLREALLKEGVELTLIYGKLASAEFETRKDQVDLEWGKFIRNRSIRLGKVELIWQPCLSDLRDKNMVIVEQANKLLLNYLLMFTRRFFGIKFCYWGHGRNMQSNETSLFNRFKYLFINNCDWWFAYTQGVKDYLVNKGFPPHKITAVQNAIDTRALKQQYAEVSQAEVDAVRTELGITSENVGIYCSAMYPEKRLDFILESCMMIKKAIPDFHMIFLGSGVEAYKVESAANTHEWIHYLGPKFGQDKVKYFKISALFLMPGLVGLGILDAFALETPMVTTTYPFHSPEIEYLENGKNGIITENDVTAYSNAIIDLMVSSSKYKDMVEYCKVCAQRYTLDVMVNNFKNGILHSLQLNENQH